MFHKQLFSSAVLAVAVTVSGQSLAAGVDSKLPEYKKASGVSGI